MLTQKFLLLIGLLVGTFILMLSTSTYSHKRELKIQELTNLTKLPGIALSTNYLEHRVIYYEDYANKLYPKMSNYKKMDYVYAQ